MLSVDLKKIADIWPLISNVIAVPRSEQEYDHAVAFLDELIDEVGEEENHPLASLMDTLGTLIETYEEDYYPISSVTGIDVLKFLMEEHQLTSSSLSEIGDEKFVADLLAGKRELSLENIRALSKRFGVLAATFIDV